MCDVIEVRDYHYDVERWPAYETWAHEAAQVLGERLDLVGFWIDAGIPTRVMGSEPIELPYGHANVTWVIRWPDMETRESRWEQLWEDDVWTECWARHPGFDGYRNMSVRFLRPA